MTDRKFDLDDRLINFAAAIIDVAEGLPKTIAGNHLSGQLIRSGTAPCLQYGEAQSAESRNDFVHKMKVSAKELRETINCLKLIKRKSWFDEDRLNKCINENHQLISIFVKSIETAQKVIINRKKSRNSEPYSKFVIPCSLFVIL
ncbi:four helix bundle protein [Paracnuella aquatica]|uniref:four helix bundle protein n=1 Tax=Paracnuella aquatica TaxID=2268757 RepID=UPI000DEF2B2E|nr:four helix bundle protein [Paracnuella aquatica]RPD44424.1 four helix bundle protein [Paracnuella aquatica]